MMFLILVQDLYRRIDLLQMGHEGISVSWREFKWHGTLHYRAFIYISDLLYDDKPGRRGNRDFLFPIFAYCYLFFEKLPILSV